MPIRTLPFIIPSIRPFLSVCFPDIMPKIKKIAILMINIKIFVNEELTPNKLKKLIIKANKICVKRKIVYFFKCLKNFFMIITLINIYVMTKIICFIPLYEW